MIPAGIGCGIPGRRREERQDAQKERLKGRMAGRRVGAEQAHVDARTESEQRVRPTEKRRVGHALQERRVGARLLVGYTAENNEAEQLKNNTSTFRACTNEARLNGVGKNRHQSIGRLRLSDVSFFSTPPNEKLSFRHPFIVSQNKALFSAFVRHPYKYPRKARRRKCAKCHIM